MPPKKVTKKAAAKETPIPVLFSKGAGITAGLELWRQSPTGPFYLVDTSPDRRFAVDVTTWKMSSN